MANKLRILVTVTLLSFTSIGFAQNKLDEYLRKFENSDSEVEKGRLLNLIANEYLDVDLALARQYATQALLIGNEVNDYKIISDGYINLGNVHNFTNNLDSSLYYYEKSYDLCLKYGTKNEIGAALNRLGLIFEDRSDYDKATEYFIESIHYYEQAENKKGMANVYNSLGIINDWISNKEKAIEYYDKSIDLHRKTGDSLGLASSLNNVGELYFEQGNLDSAFNYYQQSIVIFIKIEENLNLATLYNNLGTLYLQKNLPDSAQHHHNKALELYKQLDNKKGIANFYQKTSHIHSSNGNYELALENLHKCLDIRRELGNRQEEYKTLLDLSEVYAALNRYKEALSYHIMYTNLKDSVMGGEMQSKVNELQEKYMSSVKDKQIMTLEKDAKLKQAFLTLLAALVIILLLATFVLIYFFKTKSKLLENSKLVSYQEKKLAQLDMEKKEAENNLLKQEVKKQEEINLLNKENYKVELEHKNRELTSLTMHIQNKNKVLADLQKSLINLKEKTADEIKKGTKRIIKDIDNNIKLDSDWNQFKVHFDKVNVGFFDNIQQQFPELTKNDLKLCAYLKMNLSSKEMAQILNISIAGINKSRNRLRKKLNLDPESNLTKFIMSI